ncbi:hypothetical protein ACFXK0_15080 [Nocardia sp. NPDC059177]|uniref:hypothetical protein n=1 Tax=Nocardia sp. NPDC059177 TaxID=3346759 RepID=UPI0036C31240
MPDPAQVDHTAVPEFSPGDRWVPVDRRWLGLDRSTIWPALVVVAVAAMMGTVAPAINDAVPYDDRVRPGDVLVLKGGVEFVPTPGWGITEGVRATDPPTGSFPAQAVVVDGPTRFAVRTGEFAGTAEELLTQIEKNDELLTSPESLRATGDPQPITTRDGTRGLIVHYSSADTDGALAAFVIDGHGVQVVATGPIDSPPQAATDVAAMLTSVAADREGQ